MAEKRDQNQDVGPITPDKVAKQQREQIPKEVFEAFNRMIGETALNGCAVIRQDDVVEALVEQGYDKAEIFRRGWLNIEELYRQAGWEVEYDKPGYNESYPATFTFREPRK